MSKNIIIAVQAIIIGVLSVINCQTNEHWMKWMYRSQDLQIKLSNCERIK